MDNEEKILSLLQGLSGRFDDMESRMSSIEKGQSDLSKGQADLDNKVNKIGSRLDNLDSKVGNVESKIDDLESKVDNLESKVDDLESKVDKIDASQVRMESELTEKIRALFDDRSINQDYFKTIKNTLARIENNLHTQSFMIIELKGKQEAQETELRLLRAEK